MTHKELVLAMANAQDHREWMVFVEPRLGHGTDFDCAPDLMLIRKSWSRYEVRIIEIKVKQSDLDQDVKKLKFEKYFPWSHRVSFCLAPGLKHQVLEQHPVGIILWSAAGPRTRKAAPRPPNSGAMTETHHLLHALHMGESRLLFNQRLQSVRNAREWIELANHKMDYRERHRVKSAYIRKLIEEFQERKDLNPEHVRKQVVREFTQEMKEALGIDSWQRPDSVKDLVRLIVSNDLELAKQSIEGRIKRIFKLTGEEA